MISGISSSDRSSSKDPKTMYEFESKCLKDGYSHIAGCDEVGRGPLAGPLVAAAVVLDPDFEIEGLNDSKKLSEKKRLALFKAIKQHALAYKVVFLNRESVDELNVYKASQVAMTEAVQALKHVDYVLSDALPLPEIKCPVESIVKGDSKSASIAAASILAKVERDLFMVELSKSFPEYGFEKHKGYPTKEHLKALKTHGVTPYHRRTYAPVRKIIEEQIEFDL